MDDTDPELELLDFERRTAVPMLILAAILLVVILIPFFFHLSTSAQRILVVTDWTIWGVFALEYLWRLRLAESKRSFVLRHPIDLAVVVIPFAQPLRFLRSIRALRAVRLTRAIAAVGRGAHSSKPLLNETSVEWAILITVLAVVSAAALIYGVERDAANSMIRTFPDAIWWAVTTASTVGSTLEPVTTEGRFVAVFLILLGISVVAGLAAALASYFIGQRAGTERAELIGKMEALEAQLAEVLATAERPADSSPEQ